MCGGTRPPNGVVCPNDLHVLVPEDEDPLLGQMIGTYRVLKRLGIGGMGAVYEGVETNIDRRAALKIVHPHLSNDPRLPSLLAEARAVNAIGDPGIVDIYAFGTLPDGRSYLVMELMEGELLEEHLRAKGKLTLIEAVELCAPLLQALQAAHTAGFVHRDIKAGNIFIVRRANRAPFPKLLDFGIAQNISIASREAIGTPEYIAPEQAENKNVGPRSDLYAFGCLLYELLTGHVPFRDADPMAVVRMQLRNERPHVRVERPDLPEEIDALIIQLMQVDPAARPASAADVREVLLGFLPRPWPRWPLLAAAAVVAALGLYAFFGQTPPPPLPPVVLQAKDPLADAVARAAGEIESALDAGLLTAAQGQLDTSRAAYPDRAEWTALGARLAADLRQAERINFAQRNGMVQVDEVFIDQFEYPNKAGAIPLTKVDWAEAVTLCERAGKHLCREEEWQLACESSSGRQLPYGEALEKGRCWTRNKKAKAPVAAGKFTRCTTAEGVADLSGNVAEWTASELTPGRPQRVTRGGSFAQSDEKLSCTARDYFLPGQGGAADLGFRCCL